MSEIKTLEIPKWGLSMEEGTVANWLIQEGDSFSKGQEICEIETTKIVNVLEAPFDGTLRKILAKEGETLPVGGLIGVCADAGVTEDEILAFIQSHASTENESASTSVAKMPENEAVKTTVTQPSLQEATPKATIQTPSVSQNGYQIPASLLGYDVAHGLFVTPHANKLAEKHNVNLQKIQGTGREGRISIDDIQNTVIAQGGRWPNVKNTVSHQFKGSTQDDSQVAATPLARRLAKEKGINLHDCRASGSRGRVCREDVEATYAKLHPQSSQAESNNPTCQIVQQTPKVISMNAMRRAIASRLQAAKRNAPHFRLTVDLNVESLQALRKQINDTVPQVKLSINDMLIKAAAAALIKVPEVNVQFDEENQQILQFPTADVAVAVAIDGGLITPIVKAANQKSLAEISSDMRDLSTRAKTGKLQPDEFQGGSFSISNLGMLGIKHFDAIINPPQGAIMALGAAEKRAVVEKDQVVIREIVTATLSCDHRVIDGAVGAKFLASFKQFVENPALILV
ncbi:2-oxo acid dehydrogenase subunit E2 [Acinetobacter qingfengensis]|uniref:Dihydrolipoamide acetyltransferase component of pyruvate dehydrogenase complex n=1 Tax=Acinetobacter qingfengensis TaxID=1262585 RepID=A0A1E7RDU0_9GAMM|nr:2-oxo acid dehydrogenase subunit E2 [Acinetobacter qingfengensis]KAA8735304.1 2-oxo acid dehydrogenase subunit E2 [Acinetobacter qingfengensis]OEY97422.1 diaminohydroxyphosphoribosylaminopyrimidine deaminase [Acinetobacter qingfengensis]